MPKHPATSSVPAKKRKSIRAVSLENEKHTKKARRLVLKSLTAIIQGLIDKAAKGGYQHAQLLLDLCGISKSSGKISSQHKKSLSDALLQGLDIQVDRMDIRDESNKHAEEKAILKDGHEKHTGI